MSTESFYLCQYHAYFKKTFRKKGQREKELKSFYLKIFFPSFIRDIIDTQNM